MIFENLTFNAHVRINLIFQAFGNKNSLLLSQYDSIITIESAYYQIF